MGTQYHGRIEMEFEKDVPCVQCGHRVKGTLTLSEKHSSKNLNRHGEPKTHHEIMLGLNCKGILWEAASELCGECAVRVQACGLAHVGLDGAGR